MKDLPNQPSSNELAQERTEFAKFRTRDAADRTLMAWIRTSLSLISFGFGIPTIVGAIEKTRAGQVINPEHLSVIIGLSFVAVGVFGLVTALRSHRRMLKLIRRGKYIYQDQDSNATEVAAFALLLIGIISFIGILIKALSV